MPYVIPYDTILPEFCATRNTAPYVIGNTPEGSPRLDFIKRLLNQYNIDYVVDSFEVSMFKKDVMLHNIYLMGTSNKMVMAHHDTVNPDSDNCNDNSASVINAIATKVLNPEVHVVITDGEEVGGQGSHIVAEKILDGYFGEIEYVVNLELTAAGGKNFFTEPYPRSGLYKKIKELYPDCVTHRVPFHDGMILRGYGIDSLVINPCPLKADGTLDLSLLYLCHKPEDRITNANFDEMDEFVREVVTPLIA